MAMNPNNVREEVASNTSSNNGASVASSVSFGHTENNLGENEENWNEETWNEENENAGPPGATFSIPFSSQWFLQAGSRELFNKTAAELIAAHPEWNLERVGGNPLAYGDDQPGYVFWVAANGGVDPPGLFATWPAFAAAMEERLPGLGLPADLQPLTGWRPPPPMTNYMRRALNRIGGRRLKSRKQVKRRRTLKARGKSRRRRRNSRRT